MKIPAEATIEEQRSQYPRTFQGSNILKETGRLTSRLPFLFSQEITVVGRRATLAQRFSDCRIEGGRFSDKNTRSNGNRSRTKVLPVRGQWKPIKMRFGMLEKY